MFCENYEASHICRYERYGNFKKMEGISNSSTKNTVMGMICILVRGYMPSRSNPYFQRISLTMCKGSNKQVSRLNHGQYHKNVLTHVSGRGVTKDLIIDHESRYQQLDLSAFILCEIVCEYLKLLISYWTFYQTYIKLCTVNISGIEHPSTHSDRLTRAPGSSYGSCSWPTSCCPLSTMPLPSFQSEAGAGHRNIEASNACESPGIRI